MPTSLAKCHTPRRRRILQATVACLLLVTALGCGGGQKSDDDATPRTTEANGLSAAELENGIGPVTAISLSAIDQELAERGNELYDLKCSMCHKIDERYIGPPLNDVLTLRTPAYVMNMILNPVEMVQRHPEAKKLLAEYAAPMADQSLTQDEARAILEYLRTVQAEHDTASDADDEQ